MFRSSRQGLASAAPLLSHSAAAGSSEQSGGDPQEDAVPQASSKQQRLVSCIFQFDELQLERWKIQKCRRVKIFPPGIKKKAISSNERTTRGFDPCRRLRTDLKHVGSLRLMGGSSQEEGQPHRVSTQPVSWAGKLLRDWGEFV